MTSITKATVPKLGFVYLWGSQETFQDIVNSGHFRNCLYIA